MKLDGKVAVVTGGVSGIGRAISLALAREGASVAVNYSRSEADGVATTARLQELGARCLAVRADVSLEPEVVAMRDRILKEFGRVDLLVNNAGTTIRTPLLDTALEDWERVMAVNLRGPFLCIKHFGRIMVEQGGGTIVNISSRSGLVPEGSSAAYCVSKAGLVMLTKCAASSLAPSVRVNAVAPGFIETPWYDRFGWDRTQEREAVAARTPLRRVGTPEEVAEAVLFLASDSAGFMTGQTLVLDGGRLMH